MLHATADDDDDDDDDEDDDDLILCKFQHSDYHY
jgi:hypothetical protein